MTFLGNGSMKQLRASLIYNVIGHLTSMSSRCSIAEVFRIGAFRLTCAVFGVQLCPRKLVTFSWIGSMKPLGPPWVLRANVPGAILIFYSCTHNLTTGCVASLYKIRREIRGGVLQERLNSVKLGEKGTTRDNARSVVTLLIFRWNVPTTAAISPYLLCCIAHTWWK